LNQQQIAIKFECNKDRIDWPKSEFRVYFETQNTPKGWRMYKSGDSFLLLLNYKARRFKHKTHTKEGEDDGEL
jgi:hypothetical protein